MSSAHIKENIKAVIFDLDDTLVETGLITAEQFRAAGTRSVPSVAALHT